MFTAANARQGTLLRALAVSSVWFGMSAAQAQQPILPYQEYSKRVKGAEIAAPLKSDLFGESVSLYNGATEFVVTDVDIPGNSALPVRLGRRFKVETWTYGTGRLGGFGAWDIDVPYITGVFAEPHKWETGQWGRTKRCSEFWFPVLEPLAGVQLHDFWSGNYVHIPGQADQEILHLDNTGNAVPTLGGPYYWGTASGLRFSCKDNTLNGYPGEGFVAVDQNGTRYTFDVGVEREGGELEKPGVQQTLARKKIFLLVSKIEDRHDNYVTYTYQSGRLTSISANDGRYIQLSYKTGTSDIEYVTAHGRTWKYTYATTGWGFGYGQARRLIEVTRPDLSKWTYDYAGLLQPTYPSWDAATVTDSRCLYGAPAPYDEFILTATHPSGAVGTFEFGYGRMYRSGTPDACAGYASAGESTYFEIGTPDYFDLYALGKKTITGPALSGSGRTPMIWQYGYGDPNNGAGGRTNAATPCMSCPQSKEVAVTNPDNTQTIHVFGTLYGYNDGRVLSVRTLTGPGGTPLEVVDNQYVTDAEAASMPFPDLYGTTLVSQADPSKNKRRPLKSRSIQQGGVTYTYTVNGAAGFDPLGRARDVTKASTLPFSKRLVTTFRDDYAKWVLGQVAKVWDATSQKYPEENEYHDDSLLLKEIRSFGRLLERYEYNPIDGTLLAVRNGRTLSGNPSLKLTDWHRGLPRRLDFVDGTYISASISHHGEVLSVTDQLQNTTIYEYDNLGRIKVVTFPTGDDVSWTQKQFDFRQINTTEMGIEPGHWRHTVTHGNYRKITYLDALWRPVITHEYDSANSVATQRFACHKYDHDGRDTFTSYPVASATSIASCTQGVTTVYDALGRKTTSIQDSELGPLTTLTEYLEAGRISTKNPRGFTTTVSYQAFDKPDTSAPVYIEEPEGKRTSITRDQFGKVRAIQRYGAYSGEGELVQTGELAVNALTNLVKRLPVLLDTSSAPNDVEVSGTQITTTQTYIYDAQEMLCKRIEPESGAAIFAYDAAGHIDWSTEGSSLTSAVCDRDSVSVSARIDFGYDLLNRLETVAYPDGTQNLTFTYWPDGLVRLATAKGPDAKADVVTEYVYNTLRLPKSETRSVDGWKYSVAYLYNALGMVSGLVYPDGFAIDVLPNALGQPTKSGTYATSVTYWPNGAVQGFNYGNGLVRSSTQNIRKSLDLLTYAKAGANLFQVKQTYDENGNVVQIDDQSTDPARAGLRTKLISYDDVDRIETANAPKLWGTSTYSYDPLDNIRRETRDAQIRTFSYSPNNRLTQVFNESDQPLYTYAYDAKGRVSARNGSSLIFDDGSRLRSIGPSGGYYGGYEYDANGRRAVRTDSAGTTYFLYSGAGELLYEHAMNAGQATRYHYLGSQLVAKVVDAVPTPAAPIINSMSPNSTGSYAISWGQVSGATRYRLEEKFNSGNWRELGETANFSWPVTGQAAGTYSYKAVACHDMACSLYSGIKSITVSSAAPPTFVPALQVNPATSTNGSYVLSWSSHASVGTYRLEELVSGIWQTIQDSAATSRNVSGKLQGSYSYRVRSCNTAGCASTPSNVGTAQVSIAPPLFQPAGNETNTSGNYTISWGTVDLATSYKLQERTNGGGWSTVQDSAATSKSFTGKAANNYEYQVQGCNSAGCGAFSSSPKLIQVLQVPPPVTGLVVYSNGSTYCQGSWNPSSGASYYSVDLSGNLFQTGDTSFFFDAGCGALGVAACNASGCSSYVFEGAQNQGGAAAPGEEEPVEAGATGEGQ
jgi:YD repeat-containing protein